MKRIAIVLGLLLFSQAAFAGGTVLYMSGADYNPYEQPQQTYPVNPNANLYTPDGIYSANGTYSANNAYGAQSGTVRKVRVGRGPNYNDSNVYWNFGGINFGSGFTSTGSSVKQY